MSRLMFIGVVEALSISDPCSIPRVNKVFFSFPILLHVSKSESVFVLIVKVILPLLLGKEELFQFIYWLTMDTPLTKFDFE
ncbi:Uncharacterised protein [Chlamydia trachomatis]|nr:Uncharacterised protein [Chlamydia trachomatis]